VVVESRLIAGGNVCAKGEVVAVQVPENMMLALLKNNGEQENIFLLI
jgi:hypothetical protein